MTTTLLAGSVCWDLIETPVGALFGAVGARGVVALDFGHDFGLLPPGLGDDARRSRSALSELRSQLAEYFAGERRSFDLELDLSSVSEFGRWALAETARIPYGQTRTYGQVAASMGRPEAARAVGGALNRNPVCVLIPCHRVLGSDGSLTGFGGGLERKRRLLELERQTS